MGFDIRMPVKGDLGRGSAKNWFDEGRDVMAKATKGTQKDISKWNPLERIPLSEMVEEAGIGIPKNLTGEKIGLPNKGSIGNTLEYRAIAGDAARSLESPSYVVFTAKVAEAFRKGFPLTGKDYDSRDWWHNVLMHQAYCNDKTKRKKARTALKTHFDKELPEDEDTIDNNSAE